MTMAKKLPLLAPSIHTFEVNGTYTDCEAKRTVFMEIQKMVFFIVQIVVRVVVVVHTEPP